MPVSSIIAIPAHPRANSYITLSEANTYFADRDNSTSWTGATDDLKKQTLIEATRLIDSYRFHHYKLKNWQRLEFPRNTVDVAGGVVQGSTNVTNGTIQDDDLKDQIGWPDDFWNNGAVWFPNEGDNNYMQFYFVTDFVASTGTLTISGEFGTALANTEQYELIAEVPPEVKWATCETTLAIIDDLLATSNTSNIKSMSLDTESVTYFDKSVQTVELPVKAEQLLKPYISRVGRIINRPLFR